MKRGFNVVLVLFGLITLTLTTPSSKAYACKCVEKQSVIREMEQSKAVFSGKVIGELNQESQQKILFEVKEAWKGITESQVILVTELSDCSVNFYLGGEYLVYASENDGELTSDFCNRTTELSGGNEDLEILGEGSPPTNEVNLESEIKPFEKYRKMWIPIMGIVVTGFLLVWWQLRKNKN